MNLIIIIIIIIIIIVIIYILYKIYKKNQEKNEKKEEEENVLPEGITNGMVITLGGVGAIMYLIKGNKKHKIGYKKYRELGDPKLTVISKEVFDSIKTGNDL